MGRSHDPTVGGPLSRRRAFIAVVVAAITSLAFAMPSAVQGHLPYFGSSNCGADLELSNCVANNKDHQLHYYQLQSGQLNASRWVMENVYAPTQLNYFETTISNADAIVYDFTFGLTGWWGVTYCGTGASQGGTDPDRWCRPFTVQYNLSYPGVFDTQADRRYIACHELGHSVGLRDLSDGATCMDDTQIVHQFLSAHQIGDINAQY
jgi:hypothetical protein